MGISKWNAGIIRPVPVAPAGPYETGAAPGVWTLDQEAYWQKQGLWPTAGTVANYIEDVFSTYLYTGNNTNPRTIVNGIDLIGKGGLVWTKNRNNTEPHILVDTVRGSAKNLSSNNTDAQAVEGSLTAFTSSGYTISNQTVVNGLDTYTYASWTFRKQPKFFDVQTFTTVGATATFNHNLGSVPGMIIFKSTAVSGDWYVWHRSLGNSIYLVMNTSAATATATNWCIPTNSQITISASNNTAYVAYIFAHNAGGFGLTGNDNVISCGTFTTDGTGAAGNITLGYESQWVMFKRSDGVGNWQIVDTMRGSSLTSYNYISPTVSNAESSSTSAGQGIFPTATGFYVGNNFPGANQTYVYIAIRRGPMKVPTLGTTVFTPVTSSAQTGTITSGFPTDLVMELDRTTGQADFNRMFQDRLRGKFQILGSATANAETVNGSTASFDSNTGIILNGGGVYVNGFVYEQFRRAPGFFDEVCYTGSYPSNPQIQHNLTVTPELLIAKCRSSSGAWYVNSPLIGSGFQLGLSSASAKTSGSTYTLTSTYFQNESINFPAGATFVAYLFATCAGVSKVGLYTGTGALQTVACGFTSGARFVLIKRTDDAGDWYVWDSARGITSGNDPYLLINSTAAEVTGTNYVDTDTTGFKVTAAAPAELNAVGGTYIFLAIA